MAVIQMPSRGGKDETGMITTWYKKTGDWVAQGDELFSFDTDEGTYTVKSQKAGRLVAIFVPEGELVHCPADVGMLSAPTPDSVLNLGRTSYLDEAAAPDEPSAQEAADAPGAPAPEALAISGDTPDAPAPQPESPDEPEPASVEAPDAAPEVPEAPAGSPEPETEAAPDFSEEELLQYVEDDTGDLEALDEPAQQQEIEEELAVAPDEPSAASPDETPCAVPARPACLTADADLTVCTDIAGRTGVRIAAMARFAAMHTALAGLLTPVEATTLRELDALPSLPDVLDLSATAVTAAALPGDGSLRLIVPAPRQALRADGDALELYPVLHLSLAFDERTLSAADAAQALSDTCAHLENLLSLLI